MVSRLAAACMKCRLSQAVENAVAEAVSLVLVSSVVQRVRHWFSTLPFLISIQ